MRPTPLTDEQLHAWETQVVRHAHRYAECLSRLNKRRVDPNSDLWEACNETRKALLRLASAIARANQPR